VKNKDKDKGVFFFVEITTSILPCTTLNDGRINNLRWMDESIVERKMTIESSMVIRILFTALRMD
jgi:hypothetical protein